MVLILTKFFKCLTFEPGGGEGAHECSKSRILRGFTQLALLNAALSEVMGPLESENSKKHHKDLLFFDKRNMDARIDVGGVAFVTKQTRWL
jgi:hypothetical protein